MDSGLNYCSVLVADENASSRTILVSALNEIGFGYVRSVSNGAMAMMHLTQSVGSPMNSSTPPVDLIVSEWDMDPVGGLMLAKWVRNSVHSPNRLMPMAIISGNLDAEKVEQARQAGINSVMAKPFTMDKLKAHLLALLKSNPVFVKNSTYFGPDRRRRKGDVVLSEHRLMRDITNEDLGQGTHPDLGGFTLPNYMKQIMAGHARESIDRSALSWASTLLKDYNQDYADWIADDVKAMRNALKIIIDGGEHRGRALSVLHTHSLRMVREGDAMNYPLISALARTLKAAFEGTEGNRGQVLEVAETSVQGLEAVIKEHVSGRSGAVAYALEASLYSMERKLRSINPGHISYSASLMTG